MADITRRSFVTGALTAAAAMAPTAAIAQPAVNDETAWDKECDVLVIGYGGAGAASAITAHDAGAEVLIIEKMPFGGGNTACSGGGVLCPDDKDSAYTYVTKLFDFSRSEMDESLVRVFADMSVENVDWLCSLKPGAQMSVYGGAGYKQVEGADAQKKYGVDVVNAVTNPDNPTTGHSGASLFELYDYAVNERGIEVMLSTPAKRLLTNAVGEVVGAKATVEDGTEINIKARKAVILTTGGYEYDQQTLQNFVKGSPIYALGAVGNTGDGIRMAQAVGAGLWHMTGVSCGLGVKMEDYPNAYHVAKLKPSMIWVNKLGKRFVNEKGVETHAGLLAVDHFDAQTLDYNEIPFWVVFDEAARLKGRTVNCGFWSEDNLEEIESGLIVKADTVAELADKIDVPAETLTATVDKWNEDIVAGEDTVFGRPIANVKNVAYNALNDNDISSAPLETAPYYALQIYPALINTQGGPRRNDKAQILDAFGEPIPRLYSSGEMGSLWGIIYQGAGNNAESLVFGRIAGENAAKLENWDV